MHSDVRAGRLRAAAGRHAETLDVAAAIGLPAEYYLPLDVIVRAWTGDEESTRAAAASIEANAARGSDQVVIGAHWALAVLHIGAARYEEALAETDFIGAQNVIGYPAQALPLSVEAAVRSGQIDRAQHAFADLESRAAASGTPWALGLLARSRAILSESPEAESYFQEAIALLEQTSVATDVARTRLLYGERLRRNHRNVDARAQLRLAYDYFAEIGAMGFAERARVELRATGEHARKRTVETSDDLTPQETQISRLVGQGASNHEIAAQLFISPSTVEYHLAKVFRKVGVKSRTQLARRVLQSEP